MSVVALFALVLGVMSGAGAVTLPIIGSTDNGLNDLAAIGQGTGQTPALAPTQSNAEPALLATPRAVCGPGSKPEPGIQGRVPAGSGDNGLRCNMTQISHQGTSGGFKTFRYVDTRGHVCAFYDTALLFPTNAINAAGASLGVAVLDMSDPAHPVQTDTLTQTPMMTPHESLNLNTTRGLLAAVNGNPSTEPGLVSIYDVHTDCRHPVLDSTTLVARFGHESGFSPDGRTFYATATGLPAITAIDVTDPKNPHAIWQGNITAHGMTLSDDGKRAYVADPTGGQMLILDTSQIQARQPHPQAREVSRLTWKSASIPQNAIPFTEQGHPYVLEFDEYTAGTLNPHGSRDTVGAARIIDIANEAKPFVVANLRLQVNQPAAHAAAGNDPGTFSPAQGYAAHYCNIPTRVDPQIVACSFIASGLRVFNISDLLHPREIGYFVAPTKPNTETGYTNSDYAMSQPAFDTARHEIWYTDGGTGFYVLRLDNGLWPTTRSSSPPPRPGCPTATGSLARRSLGPVRLGMTRARVRKAFTKSTRRGRQHMDFFCLTPIGIRVGYPSRAVLRSLSHRAQGRIRGRAVLALTSNPHFALRGVHPGARLAPVAKRLRAGRGIRIGRNTWYVLPAGPSRGVLKVKHGVIEEIGIADKSLTANRAATRRLLANLT
ncbi:MAG: LVIVD repeat-containing protein [Solirubrobacteraceae bacterium]